MLAEEAAVTVCIVDEGNNTDARQGEGRAPGKSTVFAPVTPRADYFVVAAPRVSSTLRAWSFFGLSSSDLR